MEWNANLLHEKYQWTYEAECRVALSSKKCTFHWSIIVIFLTCSCIMTMHLNQIVCRIPVSVGVAYFTQTWWQYAAYHLRNIQASSQQSKCIPFHVHESHKTTNINQECFVPCYSQISSYFRSEKSEMNTNILTLRVTPLAIFCDPDPEMISPISHIRQAFNCLWCSPGRTNTRVAGEVHSWSRLPHGQMCGILGSSSCALYLYCSCISCGATICQQDSGSRVHWCRDGGSSTHSCKHSSQ